MSLREYIKKQKQEEQSKKEWIDANIESLKGYKKICELCQGRGFILGDGTLSVKVCPNGC